MAVDELTSYREFYDNVHGFIKVTELESKIIDSPFFQRLRNIRQLGLIDYVFPGALHNRFNHSLGVLQIADKMIVSLQEKYSEKYLFSWDEISENDIANVLEHELDIDWAKTAKFEKTDNGKTIKISTSNNCILLKLNDEKTEAHLNIDGNSVDKIKFIVKTKNNKIDIYGINREITGKRELVRMAALLHDIGHYPLSHLVESVIKTDAKSNIKPDELSLKNSNDSKTEEISLESSNDNKTDLYETDLQKLIREIHNRESSFDFSHHELMATVVIFKTPIYKILREYFSYKEVQSIAQIIAGNYSGPLGLIIHSELDADRFDYLLRDSNQTGVTYGLFDLEQIIRNLEYISAYNQLAVNEKARRAVEHYLVCRYFLYSTVIFHKTSVAFELMVKKVYHGLMERKLIWSYFDLIDVFKNSDSVNKYLMYDDSRFFNVLKNVANGIRGWDTTIKYDIPDDFLFDLIDKILNRKSLKQFTEKQKFINPEEEKESYLFIWGKIPGKDNVRLIDYLMQNFRIEWIEAAKFNKSDDDKIIRATNGNNYLSLTLNNEKTNVNLEIDDGRTDKLIVETENDELTIYEQSFSSRFLDENFVKSIVKKAKIEDYWYIPFETTISITNIRPYRSSNDISKFAKVDDETIRIVRKLDSGAIENAPIKLVADKTSIVHVLSKYELKINRLYTKNDEHKERLQKAFGEIS